MPRQFVKERPTGLINRRDLPQDLEPGQVQLRENFIVLGVGDNKRNRKHPGAKRFTTSTTGVSYTSGFVYYMKQNVRKILGFNNGKIYFVGENGSEDEDIPIFAVDAIPTWVNMRVSGNDVVYFSAGDGSGFYAYDGNIANEFQLQPAVTLNIVDMVEFLDRLFVIEEDSEVSSFSKNLDFTNFTDSSDAGEITVEATGGSKIVKQAVLGEQLFYLKTDRICRLDGRTPSTFSVRRVIPWLGCAARGSVQVTPIGIIFLGSDYEFYLFDGANLKMLSYGVAIGGDKTKNLSGLINRNKTRQIVSTYYDRIYRCSFTENGKSTNNLEWCYNLANETDFLTRDFNISCYIPIDRQPDEPMLLTGRTDLGRLMRMYQGLNLDDGSASPQMSCKLVTRAIGSDQPYDARFKRVYLNTEVLGAEPMPIYYALDNRTRVSDWASDQWPIKGEQTGVGSFNMLIQSSITSRMNLKYGKSKGRTITFIIDRNSRDIDFGFSKLSIEAIVKRSPKKSQAVAA